jgi:putative transposase
MAIAAALRQQGLVINHKKLRHLMREHRLQPKSRRRFIATTDSNPDLPEPGEGHRSDRAEPALDR